eukprot:TRINITY_DN7004_c0_g5_i3.p1 TRINITY_DN7004_c0_g5~~TRINITY_DN7004_c0_g5_i3.p1  ORF type:complete len:389 (-),score=105.83 TRINITY_DN7004_c0_g5_i3:68-1201(-)
MAENGAVKGAIKVKDGLYVGDERAAYTFAEYHAQFKVTHIVNCARQYVGNFAARAGVEYLSFKWENDGYATILDDDDVNAERLFKFIEEGLNAGDCVLVHSTSQDPHALIVIASYLMRKFAWDWRKTKYFLEDINLNMKRVGHFFVNQLTNYERRLEALGRDAEVTDEEILLENTLLNARSRKQSQEEAPQTCNRSTKNVALCEDSEYIEYEQIVIAEDEHEEDTEDVNKEEQEGDEKEVERLIVDKEDSSSGDEQVTELLEEHCTITAGGSSTDEARMTLFRQLPSVGSWLSARPSFATAAQVEAPVVNETDAETKKKEEEDKEEKAIKLRKDSTSTAEGSTSDEDFQAVNENAEKTDDVSWWQVWTSWLCLGRGM